MENKNQIDRIKTLEEQVEFLKREILRLQEAVDNQRHQLYRMSFK